MQRSATTPRQCTPGTIPNDVGRHFTPTPMRIGLPQMRSPAARLLATGGLDRGISPGHAEHLRQRSITMLQIEKDTKHAMEQRESLRLWGEEKSKQTARKFRKEQKRLEREEQLESFRTAFKIVDKDGNGEVEPAEVLKVSPPPCSP
jgi:hypothetical protein